jgi:hypothetical protein
MAATPRPATLIGMDFSVHTLRKPDPDETSWVDDALAGVAVAGAPLGVLVGQPLGDGAGIMFVGRPDGAVPDGYHLFDTRPLASTGPARFLQVVAFNGPRSDEWVQAEQRASMGRIWPAAREIAGGIRVLRMRRADNGQLAAILAESAEAFAVLREAINSAELLPGEDPETLANPDSVATYRLVHVDLPADVQAS